MESAVKPLLEALGRGDEGALDQVLELVYDDLRRVARSQLRRLRPGETLNTTALVHETYLKLVGQSQISVNDRGHFLAVVARAMRQIIVDAARRRGTARRGAGELPVEFHEDLCTTDGEADHVLAVDRILAKLRRIDERLCRVVECRFFAGMTEEETGQALGVSSRTVHRDWLRARGWLRRELAPS